MSQMVDKSGLAPGINLIGQALSRLALAWRSGERSTPGFTSMRAELPASAVHELEAVVRGELPAPSARATQLARRAGTLLDHAPKLDAMCAGWAEARAELPQGPSEPEEIRRQAVVTETPSLATQWWTRAREPLVDLARNRADALTEPVHQALHQAPEATGARAFLEATRDVWEDALAYAGRQAGPLTELPGTLAHARILEPPVLTCLVSTAACRHLARRLVHPWLADPASLRRIRVRPLPWLGAFPVVFPDTPGAWVGWPERPGIAALLDLVQATGQACLHTLAPTASEDAGTLACLMCLGLLGQPILRRELGLLRSESERIARHTATLLLRQARVAAALAVLDPPTPRAALEALREATLADPDVVEAAALVVPWPVPVPSLGPLGVEQTLAWNAWRTGGALAAAAQEGWDEDYVLRDTFAAALRDTFACAHAGVDWVSCLKAACGSSKEGSEVLAKLFGVYLG